MTKTRRARLRTTTIGDQAICSWLQRRKARHEAIRGYATEVAGSKLDVDADLQAAAIEHLIETDRKPRKR